MLNKVDLYLVVICCSLLLASCSQSNQVVTDQTPKHKLDLGDLKLCQVYSGLPSDWGKTQTAGMIHITAGSFKLGSQQAYPDEINFNNKKNHVQAFWIDQTEVTVAQFASFIDATHYITDAEKQGQAAVFSPDPAHPQQWWQLKSGYTWKYPNGSEAPKALPNEPVRYVTKNDAEHYAIWLGRDLPTEIEWEYAAKAGNPVDTPLYEAPTNQHHQALANYWQGKFPFENLKQDHFEGIAPVGCFPANAFGLFDQIGNVWEWTSTPYRGAHDQHMGDYASLRKLKQSHIHYVIKGGSFLCADNYCARYRNSSRHPQEFDLATSHVGFRTILRTKP